MLLGAPTEIIGMIAVKDQIRNQTQMVLKKIGSLGMKQIVMLTGDNKHTAKTIGEEIGITNVKAGLLPADKLTQIEQLKASYKHVGMVGDGINDAQALAAASVGITMGGAGNRYST